MRPIRQCIACRKKRPKAELLRVVRLRHNGLAPDPAQKTDGRGYYICPDKKCIAKAAASKLKSLTGIQVPPDFFSAFSGCSSERHNRGLISLLGFAVRSRNSVLGFKAVEAASRAGRVLLIVVDERGRSSSENAVRLAQRLHIPLLHYRGERPLDEVVGKPNCSVTGITDPQFARAIQKKASLTL